MFVQTFKSIITFLLGSGLRSYLLLGGPAKSLDFALNPYGDRANLRFVLSLGKSIDLPKLVILV